MVLSVDPPSPSSLPQLLLQDSSSLKQDVQLELTETFVNDTINAISHELSLVQVMTL
jgi:hypothetical protein